MAGNECNTEYMIGNLAGPSESEKLRNPPIKRAYLQSYNVEMRNLLTKFGK